MVGMDDATRCWDLLSGGREKALVVSLPIDGASLFGQGEPEGGPRGDGGAAVQAGAYCGKETSETCEFHGVMGVGLGFASEEISFGVLDPPRGDLIGADGGHGGVWDVGNKIPSHEHGDLLREVCIRHLQALPAQSPRNRLEGEGKARVQIQVPEGALADVFDGEWIHGDCEGGLGGGGSIQIGKAARIDEPRGGRPATIAE